MDNIANSIKIKKISPIKKQSTTYLKIILSFIILIHHIAQYSHISNLNLFAYAETGMFSVGTFLFLSGYGICASYSKKKDLYINHFFSNRISTIIIPLIVAIVLYQSLFIFTPFYGLEELRESVLKGATHCILPFSWYIFAQLYFYMAFYISTKLCKVQIWIGLLIFSFFYLIIIKLVSFNFHWLAPSFCFVLGYIFYLIIKDNNKKLVCIAISIIILLTTFNKLIALICIVSIAVPFVINTFNFKEYSIVKELSKRSFYLYIAQAFGVYYVFTNFNYSIINQLLFSIGFTLLMTELLYRVSSFFISKVKK